jgi:excisionase family DNA binding protein
MQQAGSNNRLLTRKEAAELLGVSKGTLEVWSCTNRYHLPVVKVGRLARYRMSDLMAFIESRTINKPKEQNKDHIS